jgi:hypothetical protein
MLGLTLVVLAFAAAMWAAKFGAFVRAGALGIDYRTFVVVGHRLLEDGTPYLAYQAQPYLALPEVFRQPADVPFLYPPPFALVGVALTVVPWPVWWIVPIGIVAWTLASWKPAPWAWPILALALTHPGLASVVAVGGSSMWAVALVFAGLRWGWPAVLIVLKPSLVPFALLGLRRRSGWVAVAVMGVVSLAMLPLWVEYATAITNATDVRWWYSLGDLPLLLVPLMAYLASRHQPEPAVQVAGVRPSAHPQDLDRAGGAVDGAGDQVVGRA